MSTSPRSLPVEVWLMIVEYLQHGRSPQHLSRLAQTSRWFYQTMTPLLFRPVRLFRRENAVLLAKTLEARPNLKSLVTEVRHYGDMGLHDFAYYSQPFYKQLGTLQNMHTLIMRPVWQTKRLGWRHQFENLVYDIYNDPENPEWEDLMWDFRSDLWNAARDKGTLQNPLGHGWDILEEDSELNYSLSNRPHYIPTTSFCGNQLKDSLSNLRACHIGTFSTQRTRDRLTLFFNWSIFTLPQLQTLCITGASFEEHGSHPVPPKGCMTGLEELNLLNCKLVESQLQIILALPAQLKRLTLRGPNSCAWDGNDGDQYMAVARELENEQGSSLEFLDIDIYWGTRPGMSLRRLECLETLVFTPWTIMGVDHPTAPDLAEVSPLPSSLRNLHVRMDIGSQLLPSSIYQSIYCERLPHLETVSYDILCTDAASFDKFDELENWKTKFKDMYVDLRATMSKWTSKMRKSDICSCKNMSSYHANWWHPRHPPLNEGNGVVDDTEDADDFEYRFERDLDEDRALRDCLNLHHPAGCICCNGDDFVSGDDDLDDDVSYRQAVFKDPEEYMFRLHRHRMPEFGSVDEEDYWLREYGYW